MSGGFIVETYQCAMWAFETSNSLEKRKGLPGAVIEKILVDRLDLKLGDTFKLGQAQFYLGGVIKTIPDNGSDGFGVTPAVLSTWGSATVLDRLKSIYGENRIEEKLLEKFNENNLLTRGQTV